MPTYITTAAIPPLRTVWSDAHGVWELELGFELLDGRPECVRLVIEPAHGVATRAITTKRFC